MNRLCALALGFVLDMALGDPGGKIYPLDLIKKLVRSLENTLRKAYADSPEAQNMAGIMLVVMTLIICLGTSAALLLVCYKIHVVLGIIAEGILCWVSMSIKYMRKNMQGVFRAAKAGSLPSVHRYLKKLTDRDVDELDMEQSIKCTVETGSENAVDWAVAPIFWICLLGGAGGIFCRCINILDNTVGYKNESCIHFGRVSAVLDDIVMFIPARIAALLMKLDVAFLKLDTRNAAEIYKRDRQNSPSPNSGLTQSVAAGALDIQICCDGYNDDEFTQRKPIGDDYHEAKADEVFWTNQLVMGTAAGAVVLAAIVRTIAYIIYLKLSTG